MATFSDMMTLLLTFFVLLLSMSSLDNQKIKEALGSLKGSLGVLQGGSKTDISLRELLPSPEIVDVSPRMLIDKEYEDIKKRLYMMKMGNAIQADRTEEGILLNVDSSIIFESSSAALADAALPVLQHIAVLLHGHAGKVRIEGHTDNVPIHTERYPSNWELSTSRAVNVLRYLVETQKLEGARFSAVGYGETRPVASNDTAEGRLKNRRVTFVMQYPEAGEKGAGSGKKGAGPAGLQGGKNRSPVRISVNIRKELHLDKGGK
jgi:chemotaxis protein MotB